jgi:uncharacterized membrane protein
MIFFLAFCFLFFFCSRIYIYMCINRLYLSSRHTRPPQHLLVACKDAWPSLAWLAWRITQPVKTWDDPIQLDFYTVLSITTYATVSFFLSRSISLLRVTLRLISPTVFLCECRLECATRFSVLFDFFQKLCGSFFSLFSSICQAAKTQERHTSDRSGEEFNTHTNSGGSSLLETDGYRRSACQHARHQPK